ncbi:MAG: hypothetical protein EHM34_04285 [Nitrosopumilales archaeon]|nr:MAG: hypothetical protein EHM34_04285 [Nitrosopumilales archaeon]
MEIKLGNSCGSCIHSNKPKNPREHAAHYEVAKTERWCFKHGCHVTRETTCADHEGVNRSAKTCFTRLKKYNERIVMVKEILECMVDNQTIRVGDKLFYKKDNWLCYSYIYIGGVNSFEHKIRTKDSSCDIYLLEILKQLKQI